jgi:hypothetical protein
MTEVQNRLITINSANGILRNGTLKSDCLFNFQNILSDDDDIISSNICVMNAQIPVSFYIINATNNTFAVVTTNPNQSNTIIIPFGNYTANSLVTQINSIFAGIIGATTLSVSFNQLTGKLIFANSLSGNLGLFTAGGIDASAGVIGFSVSNTTIGASPLTMPFPMNLLGVKKLSIKSQLLGINSFQSGANQSTTLTTIPNNNAPYTMINYENLSNLNKSLVKVRKIDAIDIQIEDENGNKIDFNNVDWTITLVLENIRKMQKAEVPNFMRILEQQNEKVEEKDKVEEEIPPGLYGN